MTVPAFDYADLVATADELTAEFGRRVAFIKTSVTPADSTKPWRAENVNDSTTISNVWAAVVPFTSDEDPDSVHHGVKMVIVSASVFPDDDGEQFDKMVDADGSHWHLKDADIVNPGGTRVLYVFKAEQ